MIDLDFENNHDNKDKENSFFSNLNFNELEYQEKNLALKECELALRE